MTLYGSPGAKPEPPSERTGTVYGRPATDPEPDPVDQRADESTGTVYGRPGAAPEPTSGVLYGRPPAPPGGSPSPPVSPAVGSVRTPPPPAAAKPSVRRTS